MNNTKLPLEVVRVLNSSKVEDRYLKTVCFTPTDRKKREKGSLYFLIEILNPWHPSAQIAEMIVETVKQEYYRIDERPSKCFERALESINTQLASLAKEGETGWVGNLNAVIASITEDKIYLTHTGQTEGYLFRGEKISKITKGDKGGREPAEFPFIEITDGKIQLRDRLIFANSSFFDYISLDTIRDLTKEDGAKKTGQYIKEVLSKEGSPAVNLIILNVDHPGDPSTNNLPNVYYIDSPSGQSQNKYYQETVKFIRNYWPIIRKKIIVKTGLWAIKNIKRVNSLVSDFALSTHTGQHNQDQQISGKDDNNGNWKKYSTQSIKQESIIKKSNWKKYIIAIGKYIKEVDKKWFIAVAIVLLLSIGLGLFFRQSYSSSEELSDQINRAQEMVDSVETKIALHQDDEARLILISAQENLSKIDSQINSGQVDNLLGRIDSYWLKINKIKKIEKTWLSLSNLNNGQFKTENLVISGSDLMVVNKQFGQIYGINQNNKKIRELESLPAKAGQVDLVSKSGAFSDLLIKTNKDLSYSYQVDDDNLNLIDITLPSSSVNQMKTYDDNLYFLDSSQGTLWRYQGGIFGYSTGRPLVSNEGVKDCLSMAIDGKIYFLRPDANIINYSSDNIEEFNYDSPPIPNQSVNNPNMIYTNEEIDRIYLGDGNRVLVYKKEDGSYKKQFQLDENIIDLVVSDNKIYFLTENNKIYSSKI